MEKKTVTGTSVAPKSLIVSSAEPEDSAYV